MLQVDYKYVASNYINAAEIWNQQTNNLPTRSTFP